MGGCSYEVDCNNAFGGFHYESGLNWVFLNRDYTAVDPLIDIQNYEALHPVVVLNSLEELHIHMVHLLPAYLLTRRLSFQENLRLL